MTDSSAEFFRAVNDGVDQVRDELNLGERDGDLLNLVANTIMTLLDNPSADLDTVIRENYETEPSEVRSWWASWS